MLNSLSCLCSAAVGRETDSEKERHYYIVKSYNDCYMSRIYIIYPALQFHTEANVKHKYYISIGTKLNIGTWAIHRLVSMYGGAHPLCLCLATPLPRDAGTFLPCWRASSWG